MHIWTSPLPDRIFVSTKLEAAVALNHPCPLSPFFLLKNRSLHHPCTNGHIIGSCYRRRPDLHNNCQTIPIAVLSFHSPLSYVRTIHFFVRRCRFNPAQHARPWNHHIDHRKENGSCVRMFLKTFPCDGGVATLTTPGGRKDTSVLLLLAAGSSHRKTFFPSRERKKNC